MDFVTIIGLAVVIFMIGLLAPKTIRLFSIWRKTQKMGLKLNRKEISSLSTFYELTEGFLNQCIKLKKLSPTTSIASLVKHHMADGDTSALLSKFEELLNKEVDISFEDLMLLDLANKDFKEVNGENVVELNFKIEISKIHFHYQGTIEILPSSVPWVNTDINHLQQCVSDQITVWLNQHKNATPHSILNQTLNEQFWKTTCHGIIKQQTLHIS